MVRPQNIRQLCLLTVLLLASAAQAAHQLSSRPGGAYTLYLDFDGFAFTGQWGNTGTTPGTTAAYGDAALQTSIWAHTAEKYAAFDVNVTTIDPAVAAGQAGSDASRQLYYDNTPRVMHTVVGGDGSWYGGGGVSYVGVAPQSYAGGGFKTNWVFPFKHNSDARGVGEISAHENGHAFGLNHQADRSVPGAPDNNYSSNGDATGNGSYAPIMGTSFAAQRGTWRVGTTTNAATIQNDVAALLANPGMSLIDDGVGHSFAAATMLPLTGMSANSVLAAGVITPTLAGFSNPLGVDNYTKDYFRFSMSAPGNVTLAVDNGGDWITPGVAAPGATLRSRLNIYRADNLLTPFAVGVEDASTLSLLFSGSLGTGDYFAEVTSFGGYQSTFDPNARYFDMGSYVLRGEGISASVVPEPGAYLLFILGLFGLTAARRARFAPLT